MGGPPPVPLTEGQSYCLRWNNHKSNLVEILDALIKVESYVDCTIVVDDQVQFKAHRVVLAANSPYFQAILQDVPMDHCSIIFPGVKAFEMRALLEYMYTGEVNVTQSQIPKIMRIAEELEVKGLFDMADLKEKFNKLNVEHPDRSTYASGSAGLPTTSAYHHPPATVNAAPANLTQNGAKMNLNEVHQPQNSSSVISTSSNISPSAAPSSSSSPPYNNYKSPYTNLYSKSPGPLATTSSMQSAAIAATVANTNVQASISHTQQSSTPTQQSSAEQWPLSTSAAAAAMLSSVYESAPDMNPLKRKKLSSISSMLMNRDTPILRNVLAQANPADSSQPMPLLLPTPGTAGKTEKPSTDKNSSHAALGSTAHPNSHSFNGCDYSNDKKYNEEPHSPYTDRSFEDDSFDAKGNCSGSGGFGSSSSANQKPEWKRYKQYTRNDIMSAIQCVRDGMSALQAARKFGVPSRTLYDKVKKLGITTGRPMNRSMKRSPSSVETPTAFSYAHGYGQPETTSLLSSMHERERDERGEPQEHHRSEHHHMPPSIPLPAAALLDHAFLQQALENHGGDIAGREALHAMALAAAAHAAANRLSTSPGPNGNGGGGGGGGGRCSPSPSPSFVMKYVPRSSEHEMLSEHEKERRLLDSEMSEREREREQDLEMEREHARERSRGLLFERHNERERERERDCERDRSREDELERSRERDHHRDSSRERERGRDKLRRDTDDEEDNHVEDLSVTRKGGYLSPVSQRTQSPYSPALPPAAPPLLATALPLPETSSPLSATAPPLSATAPPTLPTLPAIVSGENGSGVIVPPIHASSKMSPNRGATTPNSNTDNLIDESTMKREIISDDGRAD